MELLKLRRPGGLACGGGTLVLLLLLLGLLLGVLSPTQRHHHPSIQDDAAGGEGAGGVSAEVPGAADKGSPLSPSILPPIVENVVDTVVNQDPAEVISSGGATVEQVLSNLFPSTPSSPDAGSPPLKPLQAYIARTSSLQGLKTCYPRDGEDVARMVMGSDCTVILLTKSSRDRYDIAQTLVVNTTKIIIGHPLDIPRLNSTNGIQRLFDVTPTGYLDIRCVQLYRGFGQLLDEETLRTIAGGTVRVQRGGVYRGTEVIYREQPQLLANVRLDLANPRNRRRTFGGTVLVLGGTYHCVGCMLMRWMPYGNVLANVIQIGRDVLVISGVAANVGGYTTNVLAFTSSINVGNNFCVMGGVALWIGGGGNAAALMIGQFGAGQNLWVGGGVMIMVAYQDTSTFGAVCRAGFGQYSVGGGVFIMVAELENRAWGVGSVTSAGQAYACGGGIFKMIGGEGVNSQLSTFQAVAGASTFVGSGDMLFIGFPFARAAITQSQNGVGMVWFIGAGTGTFVYTPAISVAVVRVQALRGIELFMGYGFATVALNTRFTAQVVNALLGGNEFFIGGGAAVFVRVKSIIRRYINYRTGLAAFYVAGTNVIGNISRENIYVDKHGIRPLSLLHNKTLVSLSSSNHDESSNSSSSLVVVQSEVDSLSHVVPNARRFATNVKAALASSTKQGWRALSPKEMGKAWLAAFDASTVVPPTRDVEQVYAGGDNTQCFVCGLAPLPSFSHVNGSDGQGQCLATDVCLDEDVPRTVKGALQAAAYASKEPLLLPPQAASLLASSPRSRRGMQEEDDDDDDDDDSTPPALPTTYLLGYDLVLYCRPEAVQKGMASNCGITEAQLKSVLKAYLVQALSPVQANFQLTIAATRPHAAIQEALDDIFLEETAAAAAPDVGLEDGDTYSETYSLYLTTSELAVVAMLQKRVEEASTQTLLATLAQESSTMSEERLCGLSLYPSMTLTLPALDDNKAIKYYQNLYLNKGGGLGNALFAGRGGRRRNLLAADASGGSLFASFWPTVTMLSEKYVAPPSQVVVGESVTIYLQNFSWERAKVGVQLVTAAGDSSSNSSSRTTTLATLDPETTLEDEQGHLELAWVVPSLPPTAGNSVRAFLRAYYIGLPAIFAMSNTFTLRKDS